MLFVAPGAPIGLTAPHRSVHMMILVGSGIRGPLDLLRGLRRQRALLAWNSAQPRPAAYRHWVRLFWNDAECRGNNDLVGRERETAEDGVSLWM